jgi:MFS family permease
MTRPFFFQRRFWPMWSALSLGAFADNMLRQALIVGVAFGWIKAAGFPDTDDAIPLLGAFFPLAMLLFSSISGQVAEKYETALLFRATKSVELILMTIAAVGFFVNSGWLLIGALFAMGAQSAFFSPVRYAAMPKYLHADELVRGNGLCNAGLYVSILLGLFVGGLLIAAPGGGLRVAACLFAASTLGLVAALFAPRAAPGAPDLKLGFNPLRQTARIFRLALSARGVARPWLGAAFFFYASTATTVFVPLYVKRSLGADEVVATAIMGLFAIGAGLGALTAASLAKGRSGLGFSTAGAAVAALCGIGVYALTPLAAEQGDDIRLLTNSVPGAALALLFCVAAAAMGLYLAPLQAAVQRRAPSDERARIVAGANMMNAIAAALGSLSVLVVTRTGVDPKLAFLPIAALQGGVAAHMIRRRFSVPHGLYDEELAREKGKGKREK